MIKKSLEKQLEILIETHVLKTKKEENKEITLQTDVVSILAATYLQETRAQQKEMIVPPIQTTYFVQIT